MGFDSWPLRRIRYVGGGLLRLLRGATGGATRLTPKALGLRRSFAALREPCPQRKRRRIAAVQGRFARKFALRRRLRLRQRCRRFTPAHDRGLRDCSRRCHCSGAEELQVLASDGPAATGDEGAFDDVLQLAHVAGKRMRGDQQRHATPAGLLRFEHPQHQPPSAKVGKSMPISADRRRDFSPL